LYFHELFLSEVIIIRQVHRYNKTKIDGRNLRIGGIKKGKAEE